METKGKWPNMPCCGTQSSQSMPDCCKNIGEAYNCRSMMSECMRRCRWFPLIPLIICIGLFALGYFMDSEVVRVLWMVLFGTMLLMGILCFVIMNVMVRKWRYRF